MTDEAFKQLATIIMNDQPGLSKNDLRTEMINRMVSDLDVWLITFHLPSWQPPKTRRGRTGAGPRNKSSKVAQKQAMGRREWSALGRVYSVPGGHIAIGNATHEQRMYIADHLKQMGDQMYANAGWVTDGDALCTQHGVDTILELPDEVIDSYVGS
jgi:hypothetical protein